MKIEKITLIKPGRRFPGKRFAQPLGLLYLVSVLRKEFPGQFKIDLIDQALERLNQEEMKKRIKENNPDLVGFSCLSVEDEELIQFSRMIKELNSCCLIILGGPHASIFYDHILERSAVDIVVIGEGERTFPELIRCLLTNRPLEKVRGIAFKRNGQIILTSPRPVIEDLDSLPFPAWDLVDFQKYSKEPSANVYCHTPPWAIIFTSRGCPFQCAYCHNVFGKEKIRYRSLKNVLEEIKLLTQKYGVKELHIIDDIFNYDLNRAKEFCEMLIKERIKVKLAFPSGLRADLMDEELIIKLKKAGCYVITYAVDTASPRLQKLTQKNLNFKKTEKAIFWANKEKLITHVYFMLGFPSETLEEMKQTIEYARRSGALIAFFLTVVVYPRSQLMILSRQVYPSFKPKEFEMASLHYRAEVPFYTRVTGVDLYKIQRDAYRSFYFRPKIIFFLLLRLPKNSFFLKTIWRGFELTFPFLFKLKKRIQ